MKMHEKLTISKVFACFLFLLFICIIGGISSETVLAAPSYPDGTNYINYGGETAWWYCEDGKVQTGLTDIVFGNVDGIEGGCWYVKNGKVQLIDTIASNKYASWVIKGGKVDFNYTGAWKGQDGWYYCKNGQVQKNFSEDVVKLTVDGKTGYWYVENGKIQTGLTDIVFGYINGTRECWYIEGGMVQFKNTLAKNKYATWVIKNGKVDFDYEGTWQGSDGWYYCENGQVQYGFTDIVFGNVDGIEGGCWYVKNGKVQLIDTIVANKYATWVIIGGKVDFNYNGFATDGKDWWYAESGQVKLQKTAVITGKAYGETADWYVKDGKVTVVDRLITIGSKSYVIKSGKVDKTFTGTIFDGKEWYYIENGTRSGVTDIVFGNVDGIEGGCWYVVDGRVVTDYTGFAANEYATWYIKNGKVRFDITGLVTGLYKGEATKYYVKGGRLDLAFSDEVALAEDGNWYYCKNGKVETSLTDIVFATVDGDFGCWYIENGRVAIRDDIIKNEYGCWVIIGGKVDFDYNDVMQNEYGWWYAKDGMIQFGLTDIVFATVNGEYGCWYVEGGKVALRNDVVWNEYGEWVIKGGKVDFDYSGAFKTSNGDWYYCEDGRVKTDMMDTVFATINGEYACWYVENGQFLFIDSVIYNGVGWWAIFDGKVDFDYTGFASNEYGCWYCVNGFLTRITGLVGDWYVENGKVTFSYNGPVRDSSGTYWYVQNSKITHSYNAKIYCSAYGETAVWMVEDSKITSKVTSEVLIANCGKDENGKYRGGVAGDQTGTEWRIINWYNYPWDHVLRYEGTRASEVRALMAQYASAAAANDHIGYDQTQRITFWNQLVTCGYNPANITVDCEADCSAGVVAVIKCVGYTLDIDVLKNVSEYAYTGNLQSVLEQAGFVAYSKTGYLISGDYCLAGDVLLNTENHTTICVTNGVAGGQVPSDIEENYEIKYARNGTVQQYSQGSTVKTLQEALNLLGYKDDDGNTLTADGDFGAKTKQAVMNFQRNHGLETDGIVGSKTWAKIGACIDEL